jgi:hypothetical protein
LTVFLLTAAGCLSDTMPAYVLIYFLAYVIKRNIKRQRKRQLPTAARLLTCYRQVVFGVYKLGWLVANLLSLLTPQ